jgi:hypothetical protein
MPPTAHATSRFRLIEQPDACESIATGPRRAVEIPPGAWALDPGRGDEPPRLADHTGESALVVEPLRHERQRVLLMATAAGESLRINGELSVSVGCLRDRDVVQLPGGRHFRVALALRSVVGRAPPEHSTRACPVCHQPIADSTIWICPTCDAGVHCEPEGGAGSGCLLGHECPSCRGPLLFDGLDGEEGRQ